MRMKSEHRAAQGGGCWAVERKEEGKGASDGVARFLYPAKAANGAWLSCCGAGPNQVSSWSLCGVSVWERRLA
jgi:hypothetical protein